MSIVVTPLRTPPLKITSGPFATNGACSANSTRTAVDPAPMIARRQAAFAALVVRACSCPDLHDERPLAFTVPCLSKSIVTVFAAGG
jgi:hypothetical protein